MSSQMEDNLPFNLEQYFSRLTLHPITHGDISPSMPPPKARSILTPLTLKPAGYRKLREMHRFDLSTKIVKYFSKHEASQDESFRSLQVLLENDATSPRDHEFSPYVINNISNLENLLYRLFHRIQGTLETTDGNMHNWSFQTVNRPRQNPYETQSLHPILFCRPGPSVFKPTSVKLVILPLCPWEFAPQDFVDFSSIGRFDDTVSAEWQARNWVNADKMWAHLYDTCLDCECPYFAVTSYEQWIFGRFSKHYTNAWFSPVLRSDHQPVSVIEMLVYWIHASFAKEDTFNPPNLYSERQLTDTHLEQEVQSHAKRYLSDFPDMGPDLDSDDMPPSKRRRINGPRDENATQSRLVKRERYRGTPPRWKKLRALAKQRVANGGTALGRNESMISIAPSHAPSSADPLPEAMIPRTKNAWCERWRDMVAMGEDNTNQRQGLNEVTLQVYDPITGEETGDVVHVVEDFACKSCCAPSPTLSACSLSEEELAKWAPEPVDNYANVRTFQWA